MDIKNKRRTYFIKRGMQSRYIIYIVFFFIFAAVMVWWETFLTISHTFKEAGLYNVKIQTLLMTINKIVFVKMAVAVTVVAGVAFFLSHFFAGPAYHLKEGLDAVKSGDLTVDLSFRKMDEMKDIEKTFNEMVFSLQNNISEMQENVRKLIEKNSGVIEKLLEKNLPDQARRLEEINENLETLFEEFKI